MALTTGGIIVSSGATSPTTQTPSAGPGGAINYGGGISGGSAPTANPDVTTPADQAQSQQGIETTGDIAVQSDGSAQAMNKGVATEPPTVHADTPYTGTGVVNKQAPTSGGPSQAVPKTGLS